MEIELRDGGEERQTDRETNNHTEGPRKTGRERDRDIKSETETQRQ